MSHFFRTLWRNKAGFFGFCGIMFYLLLITVGQALVPFDGKVKLDQINSPPGSRYVLLTRPEDQARYPTLASLEGQKVGIIKRTQIIDTLEALEEAGTLDVKSYSFQSGRGIPKAIQGLVDGDVEALAVFSKIARDFVTDPERPKHMPEAAHLTISNDALSRPLLLGADTQGRDMLTHIINGGRILILTAVVAGVISTLIAFLFGTIAALSGGIIDRILVALANFIITIPRFPLLIVLAGLVELNSWLLLALLISCLAWPALMRAIRAQVLSLRERDYVEAAIALDLGRPHIIFREILPNMMSFVAINLIVAITSAMYDQIGLIFLGMAPINDYTWGVMLYFGRSRGTLFNLDTAAMLLAPVIAIALFQISMVLFSRAIEEIFDPRLRGA